MVREIKPTEVNIYLQNKFVEKTIEKDGRQVRVLTKTYSGFKEKTGLFFQAFFKTLLLGMLFKTKRAEILEQWEALGSGKISVEVPVSASNAASTTSNLFDTFVTKAAKEKQTKVTEPFVPYSKIETISDKIKVDESGQVLKNKNPDKSMKPVTRTGIQDAGGLTIISSKKAITAGFASCFHTEQNRDEIYDLILDARMQQDPVRQMFSKADDPKPVYAQSIYENFRNNLAYLHHALPGEPHKKSMKIYWSPSAEKELLPHMFKENPDMDDLVFTIIPGEECSTEFQADDIDFSYQLQFVGIGKDKIFSTLATELSVLSKEVIGEDWSKAVINKANEICDKNDFSNSMVKEAVLFNRIYESIKFLKDLSTQKELSFKDRQSRFERFNS